MSSEGFTVFDTSVIQSIRNLSAGGLYCYLKSIGGQAIVNDLQVHCEMSPQKLNKAIMYLRDLGLIAIHQESPTLECAGDNLITISK